LHDAVTGEEVARISSTGVDFAAALEHGRRAGGPALRELTFHQRAALLKALAGHLREHREELYAISARTGATLGDSKFDVDGGIGLRAPSQAPVDLAEVLSPSLFAEGRVVVVQAAHEAGKELAGAIVEQAADPAEGIVLVVVHTGGARNKAMVDALRKAGAKVTTCARITRAEERSDFVRSEVRRLGGKIEPAAIGVVLESVGSDLRELAAAVGQLVADTAGRVDEAAVRRYYRGKAESSGFAVDRKST